MQERSARGRAYTGNQKGESNGNGKLKASQVKEMKVLRNKGVKLKVLAKYYGVSEAHISSIVNNKYWNT